MAWTRATNPHLKTEVLASRGCDRHTTADAEDDATAATWTTEAEPPPALYTAPVSEYEARVPLVGPAYVSPAAVAAAAYQTALYVCRVAKERPPLGAARG